MIIKKIYAFVTSITLKAFHDVYPFQFVYTISIYTTFYSNLIITFDFLFS